MAKKREVPPVNAMDEQTALGILFSNTRRVKRSADLLTIAQACDYLLRLYGSRGAVAKKVGLSQEMIREFLKILILEPEVQHLIKTRKIDRLDVAYKLSKITDPGLQIEAARKTMSLPSKSIRDIERLITNTKMSVDESTKKVEASRLKNMHLLVLDFAEDRYYQIVKQAKLAGKAPAEFIKEIVNMWLEPSALKKSRTHRGR